MFRNPLRILRILRSALVRGDTRMLTLQTDTKVGQIVVIATVTFTTKEFRYAIHEYARYKECAVGF